MKNNTYKLNHWCLLVACVGLIGILTACSFSISPDKKNVNLALKTNNKVYVFSSLGTSAIENNIKENESPPTVKKTKIVEKDGNLFVEPAHLENIVALISGNYVLHEYEEKSFNGYVSKGEHEVFDKKYGSESTEKIGEMLSTANITLTDIDHTKEFQISWIRSPNQKPLNNCLEMSLWTDKTYKPGETSVAKENYIMVDLSKIVEFYGPDIRLDYVKDDEILYIIKD